MCDEGVPSRQRVVVTCVVYMPLPECDLVSYLNNYADCLVLVSQVGVSSDCRTDVVTPNRRLPLSLRLDHEDVLESWKQLGGGVQDSCTAATLAAVSLQLPACGESDAALLAAFGSYAGSATGSASGSAPTSPTAAGSHRGMPIFVPLHDLRVERPTSALDASGSECGPLSLMPLIPSSSSGPCWGPSGLASVPLSLATVAAKTAGMHLHCLSRV